VQRDERILDVRAQRFVDERALVDALARTRFPLLGERHDNPVHHALRARLVRELAARGVRPAVVMEVFDLDHDAPLRSAQQAHVSSEALADAGRLDRKAWAWPLHEPVIDAALDAGLVVRAGNLARRALRGDVQAAADDPANRWGARLRQAPWSDAQARTLEKDIVDGHCGALPASAVPRIALAQRARDAAMAQALVDAATADGAILIAGNGHVRKDVGVPAYLQARGPGEGAPRTLSVGFVEVDAAAPTADARALAAVHRAYDYVWFTDATARPDPCDAMRAAPAPSAAPTGR
jgi:uncharacterized iron-regulated protein